MMVTESPFTRRAFLCSPRKNQSQKNCCEFFNFNALSLRQHYTGMPTMYNTSFHFSLKNIILFLLLISLLLGVTPNSQAQWVQTNAPYGGVVSLFAVSETNLFAGTNNSGAFLSTDNGTSWTQVNSGLTNTDIVSLAVRGTNLFAGTESGGGVFLSTNDGASWTQTQADSSIIDVYSFAVDGTNLFAGTVGTGVALSSNNGTSWTWINTGLYPGTIVYAIISQAADLFISTNFGIYRSPDDGTTWTSVNATLHGDIFSLYSDGTNLFASGQQTGLYISTDKGTSWIPRNDGSTIFPQINTFATSDSNIFVGTDAGLFLSTNTGASWTDISKGLQSNIINSLVVYDKYLYAEISRNIGGTFSESVWRRPL